MAARGATTSMLMVATSPVRNGGVWPRCATLPDESLLQQRADHSPIPRDARNGRRGVSLAEYVLACLAGVTLSLLGTILSAHLRLNPWKVPFVFPEGVAADL